jgi:heme/copper-type cytochrome/quinol oxidase subunit 2
METSEHLAWAAIGLACLAQCQFASAGRSLTNAEASPAPQPVEDDSEESNKTITIVVCVVVAVIVALVCFSRTHRTTSA